jgi:hypothetical protein
MKRRPNQKGDANIRNIKKNLTHDGIIISIDNPMQDVFSIGRSLKIELIVVFKMHFHQVLVANFGFICMIQMMQSNDPFFLPIIAYIRPIWTIHIFVMI